jgi:hypothetical protein
MLRAERDRFQAGASLADHVELAGQPQPGAHEGANIRGVIDDDDRTRFGAHALTVTNPATHSTR